MWPIAWRARRPSIWLLLILPIACTTCSSPTGTDGARDNIWHVPGDRALLQDAIDAAADGDTILISPGTYRGARNTDLRIEGKGLAVIGVAGAESTVIDCEGLGGFGMLIFHTGSTPVYLQRLTIARAQDDHLDGSGIACYDGKVFVEQCIFLENLGLEGGAMYVGSGEVVLRDCEFRQNAGRAPGSALAVGGGRARVEACRFLGNYGEWAAILVARAIVDLEGCFLERNSGGGLSCVGGLASMWRSLVAHNAGGGGLVVLDGGVLQIRSCTVANNVGGREPGGVFIGRGSNCDLEATVVWGNCGAGPESSQDIYTEHGAGVVVGCCVFDSTRCDFGGNAAYIGERISGDPAFCIEGECGMLGAGDYAVRPESPCLSSNNPCGERIGADQGVCVQ